MSERIEQIEQMLREKPEDIFLHYSLGMEHATQGHTDEAVAAFRRCIEIEDSYLAAYVEAGKCLRSAGRLEEAREQFAAGMELAATSGEKHMRDFIQQQLDSLP